ncbi:MAG: hypothetical protein WA510_03675, partial [Acidobacteriaceae bacterium]
PNGTVNVPPSQRGSFFMAATSLVEAGLLVSTFPLVLLLLVGAAFLPARGFFSIAIVVSPVVL